MTARIACAVIAVALCTASARSFAAEPAKADAKSPAKADKPAVEHSYVAPGKRDPFETIVILPPKEDHGCGSLCEWDTEQLKLAALATGINTPLAGVQAPNGAVYIVDRGTRIGKHNGRVTEVTASGVVVEEQCAKESGKLCKTTIVMPSEEPKGKDENLLRKK
jgi:Tfp pilus assembly protein PilP